jgi:hypothetical protein
MRNGAALAGTAEPPLKSSLIPPSPGHLPIVTTVSFATPYLAKAAFHRIHKFYLLLTQ